MTLLEEMACVHSTSPSSRAFNCIFCSQSAVARASANLLQQHMPRHVGARQEDKDNKLLDHDQVRAALESFEKATEVNEDEEVRLHSWQLLVSEDFEMLIQASVRLIAAVSSVGGDLRLLRRFPRTLARKAFLLSNVAVRPELMECERLRLRVKELASLHSTSNRCYLEELSVLRSRARVRHGHLAESSFEHTDQYFWDALEALPEDFRGLASDVLVEKLRCFVTQSHGATLTELQATIRRMGHRLQELESSSAEVQEQLSNATSANKEMETRLKWLNRKSEELERTNMINCGALQRCKHVEEDYKLERARNAALEMEVQRLRELLGGGEIARLERELAHANRRCAELQHYHDNYVSRQNFGKELSFQGLEATAAKELLKETLPSFARRVAWVLNDNRVSSWLLRALEKLSSELHAIKENTEMEAVRRAAAERRLHKLRESVVTYRGVSMLRTDGGAPRSSALVPFGPASAVVSEGAELGRSRTTETSEAGESEDADENADQEDLEGSPTLKLLIAQLLANQPDAALGDSENNAALILKKLITDHTLLQKNHTQAILELNEWREQAIADGIELFDIKKALAATNASLLHPAKVAAVRAELRDLKHEHQAVLNSNELLKTSIESFKKRVEELEGPSSIAASKSADVSQIEQVVASCNRNVHTRLYEDAMRREHRLADILKARLLTQLPQQQMVRSLSAPCPVTEFRTIEDVILQNANDLARTKATPLFTQPLLLSAEFPEKSKNGGPLRFPKSAPVSSRAVLQWETHAAALGAPQINGKQDKFLWPTSKVAEQEERIGSLVVRRPATPMSQRSTTVGTPVAAATPRSLASSPMTVQTVSPSSARTPPGPGSRPGSALDSTAHGRPNSARGAKLATRKKQSEMQDAVTEVQTAPRPNSAPDYAQLKVSGIVLASDIALPHGRPRSAGCTGRPKRRPVGMHQSMQNGVPAGPTVAAALDAVTRARKASSEM